MTSLGFRRGCDFIAERVPPQHTHPVTPASLPVPSTASKPCRMSVFKGFLPLFVYSGLAVALSTTVLFGDIDFSDNVSRGLTIGAAAGSATAVILANNCATWYNLVLFFHIGIESKVIETAFTYAMADGTSTEGMALAYTAGAVIIVHLLPFLLIDHTGLLILLAYAGVVVNASLLVFVDTTYLMLVVLSSLALLVMTLLILASKCHKPSMLNQFRCAMRDKTWLTCEPYEIS